MSAYIRITGRPKIERDSNGLRKITRTYKVQGDAVTEGNLEDPAYGIIIPFGTADVEYEATITQDLSGGNTARYPVATEITGAYLVAQEITPGRTVNDAVLTRVYQELVATPKPVQVKKDVVTRLGADRLEVTRTYIVKNPYSTHYATGKVGVNTITVSGTSCTLGEVKSKDSGEYTEFIEIFYQAGILSQSIDYKYGQKPNHKLELRATRGIIAPSLPASSVGPGTGPWFEYETREGPGNADYGQTGHIYTSLVAKGEGLISESSEVKGKEPNRVTLTTIRYITGENGIVDPNQIPDFTRQTFEGKEEKDGWELHTIKGVVLESESGLVNVKLDRKYGVAPNHKLELARTIAYGEGASSTAVLGFVYPGGDPYSGLGAFIAVSEEEDTSGEFDVYTNAFVRGSGEIVVATKDQPLFKLNTYVAIGTSTPTPREGAINLKTEQGDGYVKITYDLKTLHDPATIDEATRYQPGLKISTTEKLDDDSWSGGNFGGSKKYIDKDHFIGAKNQATLQTLSDSDASYSRGIKTTKETTISLTDPGAPGQGSLSEIGDGVFKKVSIGKELAALFDASKTYSQGLKTDRSTVTTTSSTPPALGSLEQVSDTHYRTTTITPSIAVLSDISKTYSQGLKTGRSTVTTTSSSAPSLGSVQQISDTIYRTTTITPSIAVLSDISKTYSQGLKTDRSTFITTSPTAPSLGSVQQISDALYRTTTVSLSPAGFSDISKTYSQGVKTVRSTGVTTSPDVPALGSVQQVSDTLYRTTTVSLSAADHSNVAIAFSGKVKTTRTGTIVTSAPSAPTEGTVEQISDAVWVKTEVIREDSGLTVQSKDKSGGLITTKTTTTGPGSGTTPSHGSVRGVATDLHEKVTVVESADTGFSENSWVRSGNKQRRIDTVTTVTTLGGDPGTGNYARYEKLGDSTFRKTVTTYEDDFDAGAYTELSVDISYRTGIKYTTYRSLGAAKTGASGILVFDGKSTNPTNDQITYENTYAEVDGQGHTIYDTRSMQVPGLIKVTTSGVEFTPPVSRPVAIYTEVSYSTTAAFAKISYEPPASSVDWTVNLRGTAKDYAEKISHSNAYYDKATRADLNVNDPSAQSIFRTFRGHGVETSTFEGSGPSSGGESGSIVDYKSTPILITSGGTIYRNEIIYIGENFTYS